MAKQRILKFDIIRLVALIMIMVIHASAYIILMLEEPGVRTNADYIWANVFNGIGRAGVPMFLMLSGALILDERKPFNTVSFYKKHLGWLFALFIIWLVLYGVFYTFMPVKTSFFEYIMNFQGSDYPHLWYMYVLLSMYLAIPVYRMICKKENEKLVRNLLLILFAAVLLSDLFRYLAAQTGVDSYFANCRFDKIASYIAYPFIGWYISNVEIPKKHRFIIYALGLVSLAAIILLVQFQYEIIGDGSMRGFVSDPNTPSAMLYSTALFLLISTLAGTRVGHSPAVKSISTLSFGIYLVHVAYEEVLTRLIWPFTGEIDAWLYIPVAFLIIFICSYITCLVLSKIPLVKKLIYIK